jgi:hypothetical protein
VQQNSQTSEDEHAVILDELEHCIPTNSSRASKIINIKLHKQEEEDIEFEIEEYVY